MQFASDGNAQTARALRSDVRSLSRAGSGRVRDEINFRIPRLSGWSDEKRGASGDADCEQRRGRGGGFVRGVLVRAALENVAMSSRNRQTPESEITMRFQWLV